MHLSPVLKKTLGILCVIVLCASFAVARTGKKSSHKRATATSTRTRSSDASSAKPRRSKAGTERVAASRSKSRSGAKRSARHASTDDSEDSTASRSKSRSGANRSARHVSSDDSEDSTASAATRARSSTKPTRVAAVSRPRGQQGIDGERAREIQEALIREHYLDGDATGIWDARTREAMVRFQNDNGWQTRIVPDSRALIKLGLGPKHIGLLNPESVSDSIPRSARETRPGGGVPR